MADKKRQPPAGRCPGMPDGPTDVINKYGTYNIQPTAGQEHQYPQIAQGLSRADRARREKTRRPTQRDGTRL